MTGVRAGLLWADRGSAHAVERPARERARRRVPGGGAAGRGGQHSGGMEMISLRAAAEDQLAAAYQSAAGRAAVPAVGDGTGRLRQTVIALRGGAEPTEHESPGEATVLVLTGRVRLTAGDDTTEGSNGDLIALPDSRHMLEVLEDSVLLLTVAKA